MIIGYNTICKVKLLYRWCFFVEKLVKQALLYDFYGELLTEHQKSIYEDFVLNDYSLSEIGEARHISRQGVYDIVRRCEKQLNGYEEKLHLVRKFLNAKVQVENIYACANRILAESDDPESMLECVRRIEQISSDILDEM